MKKLVIVLIIGLLPALAFADFQIGASALYMDNNYSTLTSSSTTLSDFMFGGEARLKLWIFQVGANALYAPAWQTLYSFVDGGLAFDLLFLRLGLGVGPNFAMYTGSGSGSSESMEMWGWNIKAGLDINIGNLAIGLSAYYLTDDFSDIQTVITKPPYLQANILFKLF